MMNKTENELKQLLSNEFNIDTWQKFLHTCFNDAELKQTPEKIKINSNAFDIETCEYLGESKTTDNRLLGFYYLEVPDNCQLERNRVGLRNMFKTIWEYYDDGVLIVFNQKGSGKWRFSYVSSTGQGETAKKRFTYLLGKGEAVRTAKQRFEVLLKKNKDISLKDISDAFDVEKLSKEFFDKYKAQYNKFLNHIGKEEKENRDYVKKLLGRLVFLQFVQKKGWLNGDKDFLKNLFVSTPHKEDFLEKVLEPLFFDTLNTPRDNDFAHKALGEGVKIPYLNGGLFEKEAIDEKEITFPKEYFEQLLDFFAEYNFTIDENDPNDAEMGIDPEMLGHIFENLLEDNKDKGVFYTPKEIVQYMCKESLVQYLKTHIEQGLHQDIEQLVKKHEISIELQEKECANRINTLLKDVKICDPAIGSGAFPMGLLNEIFIIRKLLFGHLGTSETFPNSKIKKEIIQNNIYGVDIARLRFWLSLVVDEQEPQPLPNLDYKIMQGNSLLESFEGIDLSKILDNELKRKREKENQVSLVFDEKDAIANIQKQIKTYFSTDSTDKATIREYIDQEVKSYIFKVCGETTAIKEKLDAIDAKQKPFFLWHLYFSDVFEQGGFDIVIGNPPYVEEKLPIYYKSKYSTFSVKELYAYFFELAIRYLLNNKGVISYITGSLFLKGLKFEKLRNLLMIELLKPIIKIAGDDVFENVSMPTVILIAKKGNSNSWHFDDFTIGNDLIKKIERNTIKLSLLSKIQRGFEIGKNQTYFEEKGIDFITGEDVSRYVVNKFRKISSETYLLFNKDEYYFNGDRLLIREIGSSLTVLFLSEKLFSNRSLYSIKIIDNRIEVKYLLGLMNSRLMQYYYSQRFKSETNIFPKIRISQVKELPIKLIEKQEQKSIIDLVDKILAAKKEDAKADTTVWETEIDRLVYELYELNEEEIKIIEG